MVSIVTRVLADGKRVGPDHEWRKPIPGWVLSVAGCVARKGGSVLHIDGRVAPVPVSRLWVHEYVGVIHECVGGIHKHVGAVGIVVHRDADLVARGAGRVRGDPQLVVPDRRCVGADHAWVSEENQGVAPVPARVIRDAECVAPFAECVGSNPHVHQGVQARRQGQPKWSDGET